MSHSSAIDKAVGQYLEKVAAQLHALPSDEKDTVLSDIESHVYAALEKVGPTPTLDDLNLVLAQMAPPASYAAPAATAPDNATQPSSNRFSRCALFAAAVAPFGVGWFIAWIVLFEYQMPAPGVLSLWIQILFAVALLSPVATTVLGLMGVSAIRASRGHLIGMPLAVFAALLYPLLALHAVLFYVPYRALEVIDWLKTASAVAIAGLLAAIVIDVLLYMKVLRWANRPLATGEFA